MPADYNNLGLDVVSRERALEFNYSPLDCNGWYGEVTVNRRCLLDDLEPALRLARHCSKKTFVPIWRAAQALQAAEGTKPSESKTGGAAREGSSVD